MFYRAVVRDECMDDTRYGKLFWTDDQSKSTAIWRTALLLFTVIFVMNSITTLSAMYIVLSFATGFAYIYLAVVPDRTSFRTRVYEQGILASVYTEGSLGISPSKEMFFEWKNVKDLKVETRGKFPKRNWLHIGCDEGRYSTRLENRDSFSSSCRKLDKKVEVLV